MQNKAIAWIIALSLTLAHFTERAFGDILFVDMNLSSSEVAAARQAARARHEHLIVVPEISETDRAQFQHLANALERENGQKEIFDQLLESESQRFWRRTALINQGASRRSEAETAALNQQEIEAHDRRMRPITARLTALRQSISTLNQQRTQIVERNRYGADRIEAALADIQNASSRHLPGRSPLSSLIISGHSGGQSRLWGDLMSSQLSAFSFGDMLRAHPHTRNLRSVFIWGCYSTTLHNAVWWKTTFPSLGAVIGYGGMAPSSQHRSTTETLRLALIHDQDYAATRSLDAAMGALNGMPDGHGEANLAGIINGCYVNTTSPRLNRPIAGVQLRDLCNQVSGDAHESWTPMNLLERYRRRYQCYLEGSNGCVPIPIDTHHSELRTFYDALQAYQHCTQGHSEFPNTDQVLGLIFSENVRKNFLAYYGNRIDGIMRRLDRLGIEQPSNLATQTQAMRLNGDNFRRNVPSYCETLRLSSIHAHEDPSLSNACEALLMNMRCIPANWITETPGPGGPANGPDPTCLNPRPPTGGSIVEFTPI